jgi:hypothetical protein
MAEEVLLSTNSRLASALVNLINSTDKSLLQETYALVIAKNEGSGVYLYLSTCTILCAAKNIRKSVVIST